MRFLSLLVVFLMAAGAAQAVTFFPPSSTSTKKFVTQVGEQAYVPFNVDDPNTFLMPTEICAVICSGTPTCEEAELQDPNNLLDCADVDGNGYAEFFVDVPNRHPLDFVYAVAVNKGGGVSTASLNNAAIINVPPQPPIMLPPDTKTPVAGLSAFDIIAMRME